MVAEIKNEVETHVTTEKRNSRDHARTTLFTQFKEALVERFPKALKSFDIDNGKWEDAIKIAAEKAAEAPKPRDGQEQDPEETPAQARARIESENQTWRKQELEKMRKSSAIDKIVAAATAAGLDPLYEKLFRTAFEDGYGVDVSKEEAIYTKEQEPFYLSGKPAQATDIVKEIFGKYAAFKKTGTTTPDPKKPATTTTTTTVDDDGKTGPLKGSWEDDIRAEMPQFAKFKSGAGQEQQQS